MVFMKLVLRVFFFLPRMIDVYIGVVVQGFFPIYYFFSLHSGFVGRNCLLHFEHPLNGFTTIELLGMEFSGHLSILCWYWDWVAVFLCIKLCSLWFQEVGFEAFSLLRMIDVCIGFGVQVLSQRNCLNIRGAAYVGLFNFRVGSNVRLSNRLAYCTGVNVQDSPSSKRRSRGPVMAAKKSSGGKYSWRFGHLDVLFLWLIEDRLPLKRASIVDHSHSPSLFCHGQN